MKIRICCGALLFLCFASLAGCGSGLYKIDGVVTWNGTPVEGATVTLVATDNKESPMLASGFSDSSGRFSLNAGNKEGVPSGNYKIVVTKIENIADKIDDDLAASDPTAAMKKFKDMAPKGESPKMKTPMMGKGGMMMPPSGMMPGMNKSTNPPKVKHLLPEIYSKPETTPLNTSVPISGDSLDVTLQGDAPKSK